MNIVPIRKSLNAELWALLDQVVDPEIPVLSLRNLGVLRDIQAKNGEIIITITPTYSGCPAMDTIRADIESILVKHGHTNIKITTTLSPPWSSDWITEQGKKKLKEYGIAPPQKTSQLQTQKILAIEDFTIGITCPQCGSKSTTLLSEFGSTACKALRRCQSCLEVFDHFKSI